MKTLHARWTFGAFVSLIVLTAALDPRAAPQDFERAAAAVEQRGDAGQLLSLGALYELGDGVAKDPAHAARLYQRAADAGQPLANALLGLLYQTGSGVEKDVNKAHTLFRQAAEARSAEGQFRLALTYLYGVGAARDLEQARRWLAEAGTSGVQEAQLMLGVLVQNGAGGPKNEFSARRWLQQAADGPDLELAKVARPMVEAIDKHVLFSGAYTTEQIAAVVTFSVGLYQAIVAVLPKEILEAQIWSPSAPDPFNPMNMAYGPRATQRRQSCVTTYRNGMLTPGAFGLSGSYGGGGMGGVRTVCY